MYKIYLKKNEEKRIEAGDAIVYANETLRIIGKEKNGFLAEVYSYDNRFLGKGYVNHLSKILVRIFLKEDEIDDKDLFLSRIKEANDYRVLLGYNDSYRVVYSEADNLPGLIVDKYHDTLVIEISSLGLDQRKDVIVECLKEIFNPKGIYERCEMNLRGKEGLKDSTGLLYGTVDDEIIIEENGLKMSVDVKNGQKTGYFLDQKENRFAIRRYAKDHTVLDCFSNSGGFSMNALTNAKEVTAIDISSDAINNVKRNATLNGFTSLNTIVGDVFSELRNFKKEGKTFDVIVLDPPAFTKTSDQVSDALRGYKDINILAMKLINQNGFLITSSCSHYVTLPLFLNMLTEASKEARKKVRVLEIKSQAPDHPALLNSSQTSYLKFIILQIL